MKKFLSLCLMAVVAIASLRCDQAAELIPPVVIDDDDDDISDDKRMAVLEACDKKANELNNLKREENKVDFLVWLYTQPEFDNAGFAGNDLYAVFNDGRVVFFVNTSLTDDIGGRIATGGRVGETTSSTSPNIARAEDLPKQKKVTLYNGMGKYFDDNTVPIEKIFKASKTQYQVSRKPASIQNLKGISGDAVFYIFTHGGAGAIPIPNTKDSLHIMSLWTTDAVNKANEGTYKPYLDAKKLAYMRSTYDSEAPVWHYGITSEFVKTEMLFGENCIIYVDACNSFRNTQGAAAYRAIFIGRATKGQATYLGWTLETNAVFAPRASQFIFDRLLGTNTNGSDAPIPKENPIQRPFDLAPVYKDLVRNNFHLCANGAELMYTTTNPDEILLTPTIEAMDIDEYTSTLYIHGLFGHDAGSVTVNEQNVTVTTWNPNYIACKIPETGNGSVGNVIVISPQGHKSNPVPLTEWLININYSSDDNGVKLEGVCTLRLRADVHPSRTMPHETPERPKLEEYALRGIFNMKGSKATYTIKGQHAESCTLDGCTYTTTETVTQKSGTVQFIQLGSTTPGLSAGYYWSPDRKVIYIDHISISHPETRSNYDARTACPNQSENVFTTQNDISSAFAYPVKAQSSGNFKFEIADNYNIRPGSANDSQSKNWGRCSTTSGKFAVNADWEVVTPKFEPNFEPTDPTPARSAAGN